MSTTPPQQQQREKQDARSDNEYNVVDVRNQQHQHSLKVFRAWSWEIAHVVVASGVVVAIFILLKAYDSKETPKWPYSIKINTMLALLTLALRAALVIVAAEIMGQSKWMWFSSRPRPLANFQLFDDASRGLLGSLRLTGLLRLGFRGSPLAAAAAVITMVSVAIGPFTQQAIRTEPCSRVVSHDARVPVAMQLPGPDGYVEFDLFQIEHHVGPRLMGAMVAGLTNPLGYDSAIQATCPTGNCTFPEAFGVPHSTIGLCSQCLDSSSLVQFQGGIQGPYYASLGNLSIRLAARSTWMTIGQANLSYAESLMTPEFSQLAQHASTNVSVLSYTHRPAKHCAEATMTELHRECVIAASCTLYPCRKDIEVRVSGGRLEEKLLRTVPAALAKPPADASFVEGRYPDYHSIKSPCIVEGRLYDTSNFSKVPADAAKRTFTNISVGDSKLIVPSDCLYTMTGVYSGALRGWLDDVVFTGACEHSRAQQPGIWCREGWWLHRFFGKGQASYDTLSTAIHDMTTAATNFFRTDGWGPVHNLTLYEQVNDTDMYKTWIHGQVLETTVCMRLEWPWLLLPAIVCLTTVVLLGAMIALNTIHRDTPVWKSSLLPLLFFGLDQPDEAMEGAPAQTLDSLKRQANDINVTLDLTSGISNVDAEETGHSTSSTFG